MRAKDCRRRASASPERDSGDRFVIVIAGGIAAGKTKLCDELCKQAGVTVIRIDLIAHGILDTRNPVSDRIVAQFGADLVDPTRGIMNTKELRTRIFATDESRKEYERMLNPELIRRLRARIRAATTPIVIVELALVFEWGLEDIADEIWVILTQRKHQIKRLIARYGYGREAAIKDIELHWPQDLKAAGADRTLDNTGDFKALKRQALEYLAQVREKVKTA